MPPLLILFWPPAAPSDANSIPARAVRVTVGIATDRVGVLIGRSVCSLNRRHVRPESRPWALSALGSGLGMHADRQRIEARVHPANLDVPAFALIAHERHLGTRATLRRFRLATVHQFGVDDARQTSVAFC